MKFQGLKNGEEGQDLVEYALLVALIALVCITGVGNVATAVNTVFTKHQQLTGVNAPGVRIPPPGTSALHGSDYAADAQPER